MCLKQNLPNLPKIQQELKLLTSSRHNHEHQYCFGHLRNLFTQACDNLQFLKNGTAYNVTNICFEALKPCDKLIKGVRKASENVTMLEPFGHFIDEICDPPRNWVKVWESMPREKCEKLRNAITLLNYTIPKRPHKDTDILCDPSTKLGKFFQPIIKCDELRNSDTMKDERIQEEHDYLRDSFCNSPIIFRRYWHLFSEQACENLRKAETMKNDLVSSFYR